MTDLCYVACTRKLLAARPRLYPQFATHNALTVAGVIEDAGGVEGYEFQRLHGMGEVLYELLLADHPAAACRVYAPVGGHRDLLAYLVRRLLENGANSSFVSVAADPAVPVAAILERPQVRIRDAAARPQSANSAAARSLRRRAAQLVRGRIRRSRPPRRRCSPRSAPASQPAAAAPLRGRQSPARRCARGACRRSTARRSAASRGRRRRRRRGAWRRRRADFAAWSAMPVRNARAALDRAGDLLEARRGRLIALLQAEGGKTLDDAVAEVREAVDFCRYYAAEARRSLAAADAAGARPANRTCCAIAAAASSSASARGTFRCRSSSARSRPRWSPAMPWSPSRPSRPRSSPPRRCASCTRPASRRARCNWCRATAASAPRWSPMRASRGVAFTGSTEVARAINRALAAQGRADRAAHRRDRRHQSDDRRCHRAAGAGRPTTSSPRRSAPPASAARRCGCSACRRTSPTASSR